MRTCLDEPTATVALSGENAADHPRNTLSIVPTSKPSETRQTWSKRSHAVDINSCPSGEKSIPWTGWECPAISRMNAPSATRHSLTILSPPEVAIVRPSGAKRTRFKLLNSAVTLHRNVPSWTFHNFSVPPASMDATRLSSGDKATFSTTLEWPSRVLSITPSGNRQILTSSNISPDTRSEPFADMSRLVICCPAPPRIHKISGASSARAAHPNQTNTVINTSRLWNQRKPAAR